MRETLISKESAHAIHEFSDETGTSHYCDVSTYPLLDREGNMVQVLEIFRDITYELAARVEMRAQAIKKDLSRLVQEDKLLSLGKLVASVAHEINNPIASILNLSKLMRKTLEQGPFSDQDREHFMNWLDLTVDEAQRSARIVRNLLSFARQESPEPRRLDLVELMEQIIKVTRHRMELAKVELDCDLPEHPLEAWGDPCQIQQCYTNLIFNALEAMPEGGRLGIRGGGVPDREVWVEVRDTGHGMSREVMGRIFEPFFTTKSEVQGVGLGLSMVYGIVSEHRGRIDVTSEPGQGACFRITLPSPKDDVREGAVGP
jgi:signal transduction histidine kinase